MEVLHRYRTSCKTGVSQLLECIHKSVVDLTPKRPFFWSIHDPERLAKYMLQDQPLLMSGFLLFLHGSVFLFTKDLLEAIISILHILIFSFLPRLTFLYTID